MNTNDNSQNEIEQLNSAYQNGKTIQSNHDGIWEDFIPHNQLDRPNFKYGGIDHWRIKPED
jgi:hypothetical protein